MMFGEKNIRIRESPPPLYLRVGKTGKNYITDVAYPPPPRPFPYILMWIPKPPFFVSLSSRLLLLLFWGHSHVRIRTCIHAGPQESWRREGTASFRIPTPKFLKALHQTWATEGWGGGETPCMWLELLKKRTRFLFYHPPSGFNNEH